jgi:uncharacterized membrane protein
LSWGATALFSLGVALYGYHYLLPQAVAPPGIGDNPMARPWLYVHAVLAATALLLGPTQFLPRLRRSRPRLHRWMGRTYIFACLIGGAAGLALASGTTAGPIATAGFGLLGVLWLSFTVQAWRLAMARRFDEHRRWMVRSFALTLAAVTLRIYLPLVAIAHLPFLESYRAISFLCWVPNLLAAELYLARGRLRLAQPARVIAGNRRSIMSQRLP